MHDPNSKDWLTTSEYARLHNVSPSRVRQWINEGRLEATRLWERWLIHHEVPRPVVLGPWESRRR